MFFPLLPFSLVATALVANFGVGARSLPHELQTRALTLDPFDVLFGAGRATITVNNYCPYRVTVALENIRNKNIDPAYAADMPAYRDGPATNVKQVIGGMDTTFALIFGGMNPREKMYFMLGRTLDKAQYTTSKSESIPGRVGVHIAPVNPANILKDPTWTYYIYTAPTNLLPELGNSALEANLPAIRAWIKANPIKTTLWEGADFTIFELPADIKVKFAAARPLGDLKDRKYALTAIVNISGKVGGMLKFKFLGTPAGDVFTVGVDTFSVLVTMHVDLSGSTLNANSIQVVGLQLSAQKLSITSMMAQAISHSFPSFSPFINVNTPGVLAFINTNFNSKVIAAVNSGLSGILTKAFPAKMKRGISSLVESLIPEEGLPSELDQPVEEPEDVLAAPRTRMSIRARDGDPTPNSFWMSNANVQAKLMKDLRIPGTHDSATNALTSELSEIKYDDIAFLWNLDFTTAAAPADGSNPFDTSKGKKIHLGEKLGSFVIERIKGVARAHEQGIKDQLMDGIRWFDLRLYYDPKTKGIFSQHGLKGDSVVDIFKGVSEFFSAAGSSKAEFVMLQVSHTNFDKYPEAVTAFQDLVKKTFADTGFLYMPPNSKGVADFDFQSLADISLSAITGGGKENKIMVMNGDLTTFSDYIVNTAGYAGKKSDGDKTTGLWGISNVVTPGTVMIIENIFRALSGQPEYLLKYLAEEKNQGLEARLRNTYSNVFNLVTLDWYKYPQKAGGLRRRQAGGAAAVDVIVGMNNK